MEYHNKIDINIEELRKVRQQFINCASNKIDTYLPEQDNTDSMKSQVVLAVEDFIDRILESSRDSLNINGILADEPLKKALESVSNDSEPFDHLLQKQVRDLYREVEEETLKLAQIRKSKPQSIKKKYAESFKKSLENLEVLKSQLESTEDLQEDQDQHYNKREEDFKREVLSKNESMVKEYESSLETIQEIKKNIPQERMDIEKLSHLTNYITEKKDI